jgi:hypothetical protein
LRERAGGREEDMEEEIEGDGTDVVVVVVDGVLEVVEGAVVVAGEVVDVDVEVGVEVEVEEEEGGRCLRIF